MEIFYSHPKAAVNKHETPGSSGGSEMSVKVTAKDCVHSTSLILFMKGAVSMHCVQH